MGGTDFKPNSKEGLKLLQRDKYKNSRPKKKQWICWKCISVNTEEYADRPVCRWCGYQRGGEVSKF